MEILLPSSKIICRLCIGLRARCGGRSLEHGCRIWLTAPPFDHSKLMVVDGCWSLVGSANWDARSLRLNFEYTWNATTPVLAAHSNPSSKKSGSPPVKSRWRKSIGVRCQSDFETEWRGCSRHICDLDLA